MAKCSDCGVTVGCSCQLKKGRCASCDYAYQVSIREPIKQIKNANTQIK